MFKRYQYSSIYRILVILLISAALLQGCQKEVESELVKQIENYQYYTRVVSQEEYDFYAYFVERDWAGTGSQEELTEQIKAYINQVNAIFMLGNELDICEPYSFSLLQYRMEQENTARKLKKENGEVIYGVEQFTLETFYQYTLDHVQNEIVAYLINSADEGIIALAKNYFEDHKEDYVARANIEYEVTLDGVTETLSADAVTLKALGKSDVSLADILLLGVVGEVYEDDFYGQSRYIKILEIEYSKPNFEENKDIIIMNYIREELYPQLIESIAEKNPVEYQ